MTTVEEQVSIEVELNLVGLDSQLAGIKKDILKVSKEIDKAFSKNKVDASGIKAVNKELKKTQKEATKTGKVMKKAFSASGNTGYMSKMLKDMKASFAGLLKSVGAGFKGLTSRFKAGWASLGKTSSAGMRTMSASGGSFGAMKAAGVGAFAAIAAATGPLLIATAAVGAALGGLALIASPFVKTAAQFENFEAVLTVLEGSSTKAKESMEWITEFAKETPNSLAGTTEAFVKMRSYGLDPMSGSLKVWSDTAAAMGKPVIQAVEAIADAVTGENERLKEFGVKAAKNGDLIRYAWTDASGKSKNIVIKNNKEIIESTLEAIMNSKYAGAGEALANTWDGIWSNMGISWESFKKSIMDEGLFSYFKAMAKVFTEWLGGGLDDASKNAGSWTKSIISGIEAVIKAFGYLSDIIDGIKLVIKGIEIAFLTAIKNWSIVIDALVWAWDNGWALMQNTVKAMIDTVGSAWYTFINFMKETWNTWMKSISEGANYLLEKAGVDFRFEVDDANIKKYKSSMDEVAVSTMKASNATNVLAGMVGQAESEASALITSLANQTGVKNADALIEKLRKLQAIIEDTAATDAKAAAERAKAQKELDALRDKYGLDDFGSKKIKGATDATKKQTAAVKKLANEWDAVNKKVRDLVEGIKSIGAYKKYSTGELIADSARKQNLSGTISKADQQTIASINQKVKDLGGEFTILGVKATNSIADITSSFQGIDRTVILENFNQNLAAMGDSYEHALRMMNDIKALADSGLLGELPKVLIEVGLDKEGLYDLRTKGPAEIKKIIDKLYKKSTAVERKAMYAKYKTLGAADKKLMEQFTANRTQEQASVDIETETAKEQLQEFTDFATDSLSGLFEGILSGDIEGAMDSMLDSMLSMFSDYVAKSIVQSMVLGKAQGALAIVSSAAGLPAPANFIAMAAMAAAVAALGFSVAGGSASAPSLPKGGSTKNANGVYVATAENDGIEGLLEELDLSTTANVEATLVSNRYLKIMAEDISSAAALAVETTKNVGTFDRSGWVESANAFSEGYAVGVESGKDYADNIIIDITGYTQQDIDTTTAGYQDPTKHWNFTDMDAAAIKDAVDQATVEDISLYVDTNFPEVTAYFEEYKVEGELTIETMSRVTRETDIYNKSLQNLDKGLLDVTNGGAAAAASLKRSFGSMEDFAAFDDWFGDTFFTDAEKAQRAVKDVNRAFEAAGIPLNMTKEEMRAYIETLYESIRIKAIELDAIKKSQQAIIDKAKVEQAAGNITVEAMNKIINAANQVIDTAQIDLDTDTGKLEVINSQQGNLDTIYADATDAAADAAQDAADAAQDAADAAQELADAIQTYNQSQMDLQSEWMGQLEGAVLSLALVRSDTGLTGIDSNNFLEEFRKAMPLIMNSETLKGLETEIKNGAITASDGDERIYDAIYNSGNLSNITDWAISDTAIATGQSIVAACNNITAAVNTTGANTCSAVSGASTSTCSAVDNSAAEAEAQAMADQQRALEDWRRLSEALKRLEEAVKETARSNEGGVYVAEIRDNWGVEGQLEVIADATALELGMTELGLTVDNFLDKFNDAVAAGLTIEEFNDWSAMSAVLLPLAETAEDILQMVKDAYLGSLSYYNSWEKAAYAEELARYELNQDNTEGYLDALEKQLEFDKKTSVTKEDYATKFDRYIDTLLDTAVEKGADEEAVDELRKLNEKVDDLADTITAASLQ